jgi:hypothetical protein
MNPHFSHAVCLLAVAGLACISRDGVSEQETMACPNHALAARLTEENRVRGAINTANYPPTTTAFVEALVVSNAGACLVSENIGGGLQTRSASLHREQASGRYYLVFSEGLAGQDKAGFGPIPE